MKSSKPIERLFQEGLKDFQASPSPKLWDEIEAKMSEKKKRRRLLPLWWQVASVAAILLIFVSIGAFYKNTGFEKDSSFSKNFKSNSLEVIPSQYRFSSVNENLSSLERSISSRLAFQIEYQKNNGFTANSKDLNAERETALVSNRLESYEMQTNIPLASSVIKANILGNDKRTPSKKKTSLIAAIEEQNLDKSENKTNQNAWAIQPTVAPVFMSSLTGGNPIEPSLQGKTSSNPNMSYGVNIAYAINKKLKIRTGVNQVALGYNTQDVILATTYPAFQAEGANNLKSNFTSDIALVSATRNRNVFSESNTLRVSNFNYNPVGSINHELSFLEVPLEIEYALVNSKFGVHLLGGASTFLLNNNKVFFIEGGNSSNIGEAENLNNLSFSANLGLGLDYNFSEVLSLNLEPKFMYQINTFQSNSSSFEPYIFGIYSGIKFKF